ncbi:pseudouridine-5'-phosphate glycosidase [Nocardioides immobilis]|uniref:Pseudouridine-5'-phosphate glycosidase n=1 Tax=Nocardioides immobilis TaxID=2049295 RepID=A0A417Y9F1_9ACTN|nr:pseudouridine-5'-phosphate glycosidase [Nocardioides immobilis]RHW29136.1 pseudouridine-5'-phosphate glycosidase [Nocardioides immobilis]
MSQIVYSAEVASALAEHRPIVALESATLRAFANSDGLEVARESEELIRKNGAVPATVAVTDGRIHVGLETEQFERLSTATNYKKIGAREIASCQVLGQTGLTTIGATIAVAKLTGIRFSAASGLGGVHHGYAERPDISADLGEMATAPILVVASGVKSFLDVSATAEVLETLSIPVLGWRSDSLPLYYVAAGGPPVSARVEEAREAAAIAWHHWSTLKRSGGILLGCPPAADLSEVDEYIADALRAARTEGIAGPAVTPFVLAHVHRRSEGRSVEASKQLILDNSALAAEVALAYSAVAHDLDSKE